MKFVEQPERPQEKKPRDKFKIVSLSVSESTEFSPELVQSISSPSVADTCLQICFGGFARW